MADALVSLHDHSNAEGPETPVAYLERGMSLEAVVDLAAAWYVNFYVSWMRAAPERIVRYEDVVLGGDFKPVLRILGLPPELADTKAPSRRMNVGKAGRGERVDREALLRLTRHYPDVDFGPIGL